MRHSVKLWIIAWIMALFFALSSLGQSQGLEKTFLFNVTIYEDGRVDFHGGKIIESFPPPPGIYEPYTFSLETKYNEEIYAFSRDIQFVIHATELVPCNEVPNPEDYFSPEVLAQMTEEDLARESCMAPKTVRFDKINLEIEFPYKENAKYFVIKKDGGELARIDLEEALCSKFPDELCLEYCLNRKDPDCPKPKEEKKEKPEGPIKKPEKPKEGAPILLYIILGLVIIILVVLTFIGAKRAKSWEK